MEAKGDSDLSSFPSRSNWSIRRHCSAVAESFVRWWPKTKKLDLLSSRKVDGFLWSIVEKIA